MSLAVVKPITITDAMLISANVLEDDHAAWSSGTTYALGDRVILTSTHTVYESLQAGNLNNAPAAETTWWIEVSPTNRWKCFDTSNSTQTTAEDDSSQETIIYTIRPAQSIGAVGVLNITNGASVSITMDDPDYGVVYDKTFSLGRVPAEAGWYEWLFSARNAYLPQAITTDLPVSYPNADITIAILSITDGLACGVIVLGTVNEFSLGVSYGARVGIQDYSRNETNDFGDTVLVQRAFAKRASFDLLLRAEEVDQFNLFLTDVRATPCLWIGSTEYEAMTLFGFYKNYDILISYPEYSDASIEIEGMT